MHNCCLCFPPLFLTRLQPTKKKWGLFETNSQRVRGISTEQSLYEIEDAAQNGVIVGKGKSPFYGSNYGLTLAVFVLLFHTSLTLTCIPPLQSQVLESSYPEDREQLPISSQVVVALLDSVLPLEPEQEPEPNGELLDPTTHL